MPATVSLREIVGALDEQFGESEAFLDTETGEILWVMEDDRSAVDDESDLDDLPDWQRDHVAKLREILDTDRCLRLPEQFEIHEWSIMEAFCRSVDDESAHRQLMDAVHGSGAFRMFRSTLERLGLREQWYAFRRQAFEQIARDWLDANGVPYQ